MDPCSFKIRSTEPDICSRTIIYMVMRNSSVSFAVLFRCLPLRRPCRTESSRRELKAVTDADLLALALVICCVRRPPRAMRNAHGLRFPAVDVLCSGCGSSSNCPSASLGGSSLAIYPTARSTDPQPAASPVHAKSLRAAYGSRQLGQSREDSAPAAANCSNVPRHRA